MIASSPDKLESLTVPEEMMEKIDASDADYYHVFGTLGGMLDGKSYITVSEMRNEKRPAQRLPGSCALPVSS